MELTNFLKTLNWMHDIYNPEMIEDKNYKKTYLGFKNISQKELDELTEHVNNLVKTTNLYPKTLIIYNTMGEIRPWRK